MKKNTRQTRINEEVRKELSIIIRDEIKDPSVPEMTSVTAVDVTNDLKYAKIYISVYGKKEVQEAALEALKKAKGFIRKEIAHRLNLRYTPELIFQLDTSIEYAIHMSKLIQEVAPNLDKKQKGDEEE